MMQRKWTITAIVCAGVFMASLDLFIVNIAFPSIAKNFDHASLGTLSWIVSGYAIVFAALLVPAGRWADAFGRKRAFLLGLGIFVLRPDTDAELQLEGSGSGVGGHRDSPLATL
jgi:MFS family permease